MRMAPAQVWKNQPFATLWFAMCRYPLQALVHLGDWAENVNTNNAFRAIGSKVRVGEQGEEQK